MFLWNFVFFVFKEKRFVLKEATVYFEFTPPV